MFGLMEVTAQLDEATKLAIIPTVVLPFTVIGMILTSLATWIAAFFGVELKAEGPRRLFEVLMKPKVLLLALLSNLVVYGAIKAGSYISDGPYPLWWVQFQNRSPKTSDRIYQNSIGIPPILKQLPASSRPELQVLWQLPLKSLIFGSPLVSGDSMFVGLSQGRIVEIDLLRGQVLRYFEIGKPVMVSPVILDGHLFAGEGIHSTHDARMYSFNLRSGALSGAFKTKGHIERGGIVAHFNDKKILLFPAGQDGLYAIDPATLTPLWQAAGGHIDSFPAADDRRVYVGSGLEAGFAETPTKVFALNLSSGKPEWEKSIPTSSWGVPVLWEDKVCFPLGDVYKNSHYGQIACYHKETGEEYFSFNTTGALISQPTVLKDHLLVADFYGKIYQFDLRRRQLDWTLQVPTEGTNYASVFIDSADHMFLPGTQGIYIYSRSQQELLSVWAPQDEPWAGAFTNVVPYKDNLLVFDKKGSVRALRFKN